MSARRRSCARRDEGLMPHRGPKVVRTLVSMLAAMAARPLRVALLALLAIGTAHAQDFDYNPSRAPALRACDDQRDHGRAAESHTCYQKLLDGANTDVLTRAESAWALGDVKRANELFRDVVRTDDKSVRGRERWGRLY